MEANRDSGQGQRGRGDQTHTDDKTFTVFNMAQCEGLPLPEIATPSTTTERNAIAEAEAIIAAMPAPPSIAEDG